MSHASHARRAYVVKRSSAGLGLFAARPIAKGEHIIEYTGEKISHDEADRRGGRYLFVLNARTVVDGKGRANLARYINHACRPNAEAVIEDEAHIMIYATKSITAGEEITYDYGKEYVQEFIAGKCRCAHCRASRRKTR